MAPDPFDLRQAIARIAARATSPSTRFFLDDLLGMADASTQSGGAHALAVLRQAALKLARSDSDRAEKEPLLQEMLLHFGAHPLRTWPEVLWALDLAIACPTATERLLRTLVVNLRLTSRGEIGVLGNLAVLGDATHALLPQIRQRLSALFERRHTLDWTLLRQLAKSLPKVGADRDELEEVRGGAEEIQWRLDCPLTLDIREEVHSRASPANLKLVRAYLAHLENDDSKPLSRLRLAQKIPAHDLALSRAADPAALKIRLIQLATELEHQLARIYAFDADDENAVRTNILFWLEASGIDPDRPHQLLDCCARGDRPRAAELLVDLRLELGARIEDPADSPALDLLYLDLELEKLSYLLFGQMVHQDLERLDDANLDAAVGLLRAMLLSAGLKGREDERLRWLCQVLDDLPRGSARLKPQLFVLNQQINEEIAGISLGLYRAYHSVVRDLLLHSAAPDVEITVNRFVDGLVRDTTLHHLGELALKVYLFTLEDLEDAETTEARQIHATADRFYRQFAGQLEDLIAARNAVEATAERPLLCRFAPGQVPPSRHPDLLGGKGAGLCDMSALGLEVPPGFVLTLEASARYTRAGRLDADLQDALDQARAWLEALAGQRLGDPAAPLLLAVRSGAAVSMPGMMDTVLNVGIDEAVARALADRGGEAFACGLYAQFLYDYAGTVLGLEGMQKPAPTWDAVAAFQAWLQEQGAPSFWTDAAPQLPLAVAAVFASWNSQRAVLFRRQAGIPQDGGTAVTVQQMVFGNADDDSCTGVVFTRDPTTGEDRLFGEYLPRSQGQDLVSGQRTPLPLLADPEQPGRSLQERHPPVLDRLRQVAALLEDHYRDMQDIEFTVQSGRLYLLQTRAGRRTPEAALRITADLAGIAAATSVPAARTTELSFRPLARGLGASPGRAAGRIALTCQSAEDQAARGHAVVLVRPSTAPEDLPGMVVAAAVLTRRGGATSHAANNARYMDKPCVVGCPDLVIDEAAGTLKIGEQLLREGDRIALDGGSGEVGVPQAADTR